MMDLNKISKEVDKIGREQVMNIMTKLISIDTSIPPANTYREYVDTISPYFLKLGFHLEEVIVPEDLVEKIPLHLEGPRINLVATKDYGLKEYITFYGHMDVVPAPTDGENKWRYPPFEATMTKSGKIYGRGTSDMKGAMICLILALQLIDKLKLTPKYNIRVMNCTDEEVGYYPGVRYLEEQGYVKDIVFCMDAAISPIICIAAAGALEIVIETIGRSCNSAANYLGINALEEMIPILNELMELKKNVEARQSKDIPGIKQSNTGKLMNLSPMFSLDLIQAGIKVNIIPNKCTLIIDRRYIPDENYENVITEIREVIERGKNKSKALDLRVTFNHLCRAFKNDPCSPGNLRIMKVISLVHNIPENKIKFVGSSGSTDMGFLTKYDVIFHGLISKAHAVNEYINFKNILKFIKEIIVFLCADL